MGTRTRVSLCILYMFILVCSFSTRATALPLPGTKEKPDNSLLRQYKYTPLEKYSAIVSQREAEFDALLSSLRTGAFFPHVTVNVKSTEAVTDDQKAAHESYVELAGKDLYSSLNNSHWYSYFFLWANSVKNGKEGLQGKQCSDIYDLSSAKNLSEIYIPHPIWRSRVAFEKEYTINGQSCRSTSGSQWDSWDDPDKFMLSFSSNKEGSFSREKNKELELFRAQRHPTPPGLFWKNGSADARTLVCGKYTHTLPTGIDVVGSPTSVLKPLTAENFSLSPFTTVKFGRPKRSLGSAVMTLYAKNIADLRTTGIREFVHLQDMNPNQSQFRLYFKDPRLHKFPNLSSCVYSGGSESGDLETNLISEFDQNWREFQMQIEAIRNSPTTEIRKGEPYQAGQIFKLLEVDDHPWSTTTLSPAPSGSVSASPSPSASASPSSSASVSASPSPSASTSPSPSPSASGSASSSPSASTSPSPSASASASSSPSASTSPSPSASASASPSRTASSSPSPSPSTTGTTGITLAVSSNSTIIDSREDTEEITKKDTAACFPHYATVEMENGSVKQMDQLKIGDRVKVGPYEFSAIFMFTHKLLHHASEFIRINSSSGDAIDLSPGHHIYTGQGLIAAKSVQIGDTLHLGSGEKSEVISVSRVVAEGLFNPQTIHGGIIVSNIRTSTYTEAVAPAVAHALLSPLRMLSRTGILTDPSFALVEGMPCMHI